MISRKTNAKDIIHKLLYADDLAVVADSEADQERTVAGKEIFGKYRLIVSLEKMEALWVGQQNKNLDIRKKLKQRDNYAYLGGAVCGDGGKETDIRRMQAMANLWRKVEARV